MKLFRQLLWLANAGLAALILSAGIGLMTPAEPVRLPDIDRGRRPDDPPRPLGHWMRDARNPIEPGVNPPDVHISAELLGTNAPADRAWGWAYLLVAGRHPVTAFLGEAVPEMAGWILTKVTPSSATLSNGASEITLRRGP